MARRRGDDHDAYTFDLEPDGLEPDEPARTFRRTGARGQDPSTLLIDLDPDPELDADLEPGSDDGADPPGGEGGDRGALRDVARRLQGFLRGRRLVAVVVVAAFALTALVVDTVSDRGRISALRAAPGGVLDLEDRPRELWRVGAEGGLPGGLAGVVGDVVVVQHRDRLLGVDPATGERRWSARLPDAASRCGPGMALWAGSFQIAPVDRIVCVSATGTSGGDEDPDVEADTHQRSTVTVVDGRGTVLGSRTVMASHTMLFAGPDGGLVEARWVGDGGEHEPEGLTADDLMSGEGAAALKDGYDLRLRLEDAVTGEERWQRTVRFDGSVDPSLCVRWSDDGTESAVDLRGGVQATAGDEVLWVVGCGVDAWLTGGGDRLDRDGDPTTFDGFSVWPLSTGGFVVQQEADPEAPAEGRRDPAARLLGPDGEQRRTLDGTYLVPLSSDGGGDEVGLLSRDDELVAVDPAGEERWTSDVTAVAIPVRTSRVAVVVDDARGLRGLDLRTGEELWSRDDVFDGVDSSFSLGYSPSVVDEAFTDGRAAVLVVADGAQGDLLHWLAVDVTTGEDLWSEETETAQWGVHLAVDGHLLRWTPTEVVGLG